MDQEAREDGYWLCLPPASSRIKGNPKEVPLNRIALPSMVEDLPSLTDGRVFRHWTNARAFKKYWLETSRRVGLQNLRFHDLRHTFTTRLQRLGVDYELRQALLGHRMPGMTADYSHGGPEWDARLHEAVTRLEKGYVLVDGLVDERPEAKVMGANYMKTGEPAGARTRDPRLNSSNPWHLLTARYCNGFPVFVCNAGTLERSIQSNIFPVPSFPFPHRLVTKWSHLESLLDVDRFCG